MKAPREQQASGRNVNRDRPRPTRSHVQQTPKGRTSHPLSHSHPLPCYAARCTSEPVPNSVFSTTHTVMPPATIPYVHSHVYFHLFLYDEINFLQCKS